MPGDPNHDEPFEAHHVPRPARLDFPGAIHFVRLQGRPAASIFFDAMVLNAAQAPSYEHTPHLKRFIHLVADIAGECAIRLHAYCVEPNSCTLVIQTLGAPLDSFMGRLCGQYAHYWRRTHPGHDGRVFASRYASKVIAPEYLPHAARRAHLGPVVSGLCRRPIDYPFSSERDYCGGHTLLSPYKSDVLRALEARRHTGIRGYREFMEEPETPYVTNLFLRGSSQDSRIVGNKVFAKQARDMAAHPAPRPTKEALIARAAKELRIRPVDIFSPTPAGALGRALVAWYGLRAGAATLTDMGRWFSVTGATLGQALRHHRRASPALFTEREVFD